MQQVGMYNSIEGMCPACRQVVKLQLLPTKAVRCPKCDLCWPSIDRFLEVARQTVGDVQQVEAALRNSAQASGW